MALGKDRLRQNVRGGGNLQLRELVSGSASTAWNVMGYIRSTKLDDNPTMQDNQDETGDMIIQLVGSTKATLVAVLEQAGIDEINFLKQTAGRFYDFYYAAKLTNGNTQEIVGTVMIKPMVSLNFAANTPRDLPLDIVFIRAKAGYTRAPGGFNNNAATGPDYYIVTENAVALGPPTDQVGAVYTSVV